MSELSMSMFLNKADLAAARAIEAQEEALIDSRIKAARVIEAQEEAIIAARIKAAAVVTKMQQSGTHWTLTAKPEKSK